jgi:hypothetical protein
MTIGSMALGQDEVRQEGRLQIHAQPFALEGQMMTQSGALSITSQTTNGVKTTSIVDQGQEYQIVEDADGTIEVTMSRRYGIDDAEQLQDSHPDLYMHLKSFPRESAGSPVEVAVTIKETFTADNVDALKEQHPDAYAIYEKYTRRGGNEWEGLDLLRGEWGIHQRPALKTRILRGGDPAFDDGSVDIIPIVPEDKAEASDQSSESNSQSATDQDYDEDHDSAQSHSRGGG